MKLLLPLLFLATVAYAQEKNDWLCGILTSWVEKLEPGAETNVLGTCNAFQAENVQSCAAADIPVEALALTKKLCGAVGNVLGKIPLIGPIFRPEDGAVYAACVGQGESLLDKALIIACQGGTVNATSLCDGAFCGIWDFVQQKAVQLLHCTPIARPGVCGNSSLSQH